VAGAGRGGRRRREERGDADVRPWLAERERERSGWGKAGPRARAGPREEEGEEARLGPTDGGGLAADGSRARPMWRRGSADGKRRSADVE
jgi:hypothetical protein